jgi:CRP-like cAMP-binding protein
MTVTRLRTRRDATEQANLATIRDMLADMPGAADLVTVVERKLAATRGWGFVMVEPRLYADVIEHLTKHSRRPQKAVVLFTRLFQLLPADGNEVMADRHDLARMVGCQPRDVSEIMGELETLGAVYRRREGRGVRYFVNPMLGTHLAGAARDKAQAEAPRLRLVETEPS